MSPTKVQIEAAAKAIWETRNRRDGGTLTWESVIKNRKRFEATYWSALDAREEAKAALIAVFAADKVA